MLEENRKLRRFAVLGIQIRKELTRVQVVTRCYKCLKLFWTLIEGLTRMTVAMALDIWFTIVHNVHIVHIHPTGNRHNCGAAVRCARWGSVWEAGRTNSNTAEKTHMKFIQFYHSTILRTMVIKLWKTSENRRFRAEVGDLRPLFCQPAATARLSRSSNANATSLQRKSVAVMHWLHWPTASGEFQLVSDDRFEYTIDALRTIPIQAWYKHRQSPLP